MLGWCKSWWNNSILWEFQFFIWWCDVWVSTHQTGSYIVLVSQTNKTNWRNSNNKRCLSKTKKSWNKNHPPSTIGRCFFFQFSSINKRSVGTKFQFRCQVRVPYIDEAYVVIEVRFFGQIFWLFFGWDGARGVVKLFFLGWKAKFDQICFMWVLEMQKICWVCFWLRFSKRLGVFEEEHDLRRTKNASDWVLGKVWGGLEW